MSSFATYGKCRDMSFICSVTSRSVPIQKDYRKRKVYVLTNYWSTHAEDLQRVYWLRAHDYDPYVMIYDKPRAPKETRQLQRWANNKIIFRPCERFEDYRVC